MFEVAPQLSEENLPGYFKVIIIASVQICASDSVL